MALLLYFLITFMTLAIIISPSSSVDSVIWENETIHVYNWGEANGLKEFYIELMTRQNKDEVYKSDIIKIGCDCIEMHCLSNCCYCRLDCQFHDDLEIGDKWTSRIYGNCSAASIPNLRNSKELSSRGIEKLLFQRAHKNYWMCDESSHFQNIVSPFYRFLCVRSDNLVLLGVFFPDHPSRPSAAQLRQLIQHKFFWINEPLYQTAFRNVRGTNLESSRIFELGENNKKPLANDSMVEKQKDIRFDISGSHACTEYMGFPRAGMRALIPCMIQVKLDDGFSCDELRNVLDDAAESFLSTALRNVTNRTNLIGDTIIRKETDFYDDLDEVENSINSNFCLNLTMGIKIISSQFESTLVNISIKYAKGSLQNGSTVIPFLITFSTTNVESVEQNQHSKFYQKYHFSLCPGQYCWRDIFNGNWSWKEDRSSIENIITILQIMVCGAIILAGIFAVVRMVLDHILLFQLYTIVLLV